MTTLLRSKEAADKLSITEDRLYAYTREGILPVVKIGRQLRWSEESLNEFIRSGGSGFSGGWKKEA